MVARLRPSLFGHLHLHRIFNPVIFNINIKFSAHFQPSNATIKTNIFTHNIKFSANVCIPLDPDIGQSANRIMLGWNSWHEDWHVGISFACD